MRETRCAVIGVGYLGSFHAEKYAKLPGCRLVGIADSDPTAVRRAADKHRVPGVLDYRDLLSQVDAVSVVVPTAQHFEIASAFLRAGAHVLVEKPITSTVEEADILTALAEGASRVLQVGHLERFNAALLDLGQILHQPLFIESHRIAPFKARSTDVSVVLDLMIHDIDLVLSIVNSPVERVEASGAPVLTSDTDIANARLVFSNGCVANLTASRISLKSERRMRIFQKDCYISLDLQNRTLKIQRKGSREMFPGIPEIESEEMAYQESDALLEEIRHFLHCIDTGAAPLVGGKAGKQALETAVRINELLGRRDERPT